MERPWKAHWPPGLDEERIALPTTPLPVILKRNARRAPDKPALVYYGREVSFAQLDDASDRFAGWLEEFSTGSLSGARNLPASGVRPGEDVGEVKKAKDDGRLPMEDHNTRIVVFGRDGAQARIVAEAVVKEAFHDVAFFDGPFPTIKAATR